MIVTKTFKLTFDEPNPYWLCADNLKIVLEQVCTGTEFEVEEVSCEPPWQNWSPKKLVEAGVKTGPSFGSDPEG